ncbi:MAG: antibiotic biosynthesis monooxygenase [Flavobacteriales bacterium]|nr:antibiotic biosynthesis monooxygenase [Flavobacteriales bacterium]
MSEITGIARQKIHPGKLDEFKRLAAECMRVARIKDTGTVQYDFYFNADETECIVYERYRDSAALQEHLQNLGDLMGKVMAICTTTGEVLGEPSPELANGLAEFGVPVYRPWLKL